MNAIIPYLLDVYACLLLIGGSFGYMRTGSLVSIFAAAAAFIFCELAALGIRNRWVLGYFGGLATTGLMTLFFGYRLYTTHKLMPAGIFSILSLVMFILLFMSYQKRFK